MFQILHSFAEGIHHAMRNPFGLDFEVHNKNIYVPLGNTLNCLGYNDHLERVIGVARISFALLALIMSQTTTQEKLVAVGHIFRGILEMVGNYEHYLLLLDAVFTVYNIGNRVLFASKSQDDALLEPVKI